MSVNNGVGLLLLGVVLYVIGVLVPVALLITLGKVVGVVGLVVLIFALVTNSRTGRRDRTF